MIRALIVPGVIEITLAQSPLTLGGLQTTLFETLSVWLLNNISCELSLEKRRKTAGRTPVPG
jgi:hypothetical protein